MRKDSLPRAMKGILVGISDSTYSVYVQHLVKVVQSSNIVVDESVSGESVPTEIGANMDRVEFDIGKEYSVEDFGQLIGTSPIDDENGLEYTVIAVRKHEKYIVADRILKAGGGKSDPIFALVVNGGAAWRL